MATSYRSRCSSVNVESMWRMAMTLAMLVAVMTASSVKKLPKVIWPIESENDRIRCKIDAKADDMAKITGLKIQYIRRNTPPGEHVGTSRRGDKASLQPGDGGFPAASNSRGLEYQGGFGCHITEASIGRNAGLFDHLGP